MNKATAVDKGTSFVRHDLFKVNFYRLHLLYFVVVIIIGSLFVFLLPNNGTNISYIDALMLSTSALTTSGLNPIDLGDLSTGQQFILFFLMLIGNQVFTAIPIVWVRRYYFKRRFLAIARKARSEDISIDLAEEEMGTHGRPQEGQEASSSDRDEDISHQSSDTAEKPQASERRYSSPAQNRLVDHSLSHQKGLGAFPTPWETKAFHKQFRWFNPKSNTPRHEKYLSFEPTIHRNSAFHSLTSKQEEELGGIEYEALTLLSWLLPLYSVIWILVGITILAPWAEYTHINTLIKMDQPGNLNAPWYSSFLAVSAFTNCGLDLLNSSFSEIQNEYLVILVTIVLLLAGNTLYPVILRFAIWALHHLSPKQAKVRATTQYLLDHPRRTFIYLFPAVETWNLLLITIALQVFSWGMYIALDAHNSSSETPYPENQFILAGFFQAIAIRHGGFYITTLSGLAPGILVLYLAYMYISNYPVIMTMRHSNVYEEHSLGVSPDDADQIGLMRHIQEQLFYDAWWIALAYFLIAVVDARQFTTESGQGFTQFAVLFEILSGYGNVGASLSLTGQDFSLSGNFRVLSKLIMIAVMLRGRHRGLPSAVDRSIMLPGEQTMRALDHAHGQKKKD